MKYADILALKSLNSQKKQDKRNLQTTFNSWKVAICSFLICTSWEMRKEIKIVTWAQLMAIILILLMMFIHVKILFYNTSNMHNGIGGELKSYLQYSVHDYIWNLGFWIIRVNNFQNNYTHKDSQTLFKKNFSNIVTYLVVNS